MRHPLDSLCAIALALGCSAAAAQSPIQQEAAALGSAQLRAAYLECDRIASRTALDVDMMTACSAIAHVLLHRDFGGDLDRQLAWWRSERDAAAAPSAAPATATTLLQ